MSKSLSSTLVEKSIHALISAIEIYNKPDFKYREENFCILIINAWELLFKAKLVLDSKQNKEALYIKEYFRNKNGSKSQRWKYKISRSGNRLTRDLATCISDVSKISKIEEQLISNIETLMELRDNSVHFHNTSVEFIKTVHEIGSATVYDLIFCLKAWFNVSLDKYNLYLLPLSFFGGKSVEAIPIFLDEKRFLKYVSEKKEQYPYDKDKNLQYSFQIEITLTKKSKGSSSLYLTNDSTAPKVQISEEELLAKYPFDYKKLLEACMKRYKDFLVNTRFHKLKKEYEDNIKFCYKRFPGFNRSGDPRKYYSSAILEEFDKVYQRNRVNR